MTNSGAIESLEPVVQATQLLQMRKKTDKDVTAIIELCNKLNTLQVGVEIMANSVCMEVA